MYEFLDNHCLALCVTAVCLATILAWSFDSWLLWRHDDRPTKRGESNAHGGPLDPP